jgi:hypothetical protein
MEKVWNENKEVIIKDIQQGLEEELLEVCEKENWIKRQSFIKKMKEKNEGLYGDKDLISELNRKYGVDDIVFNNKIILYKIKMKVKNEISLECEGEEENQVYT